MTLRTGPLRDRAVVRATLSSDRALTAYALGDLDDHLWPDSTFYGAWRGDTLVALVLVYAGLDPAVLAAFGEDDGVRAIFAQQPLPEEIYYLFLPEMEPVLTECYELYHPQREWRMVLDPAAFCPPDMAGVERLAPEDAGALAALFRHAAEPGEEIVAFSPAQMAQGMFYGIRDGAALVATAGTHVWSVAEGVAAIGNVFTLPAYRGRGCARRCTGAVAAAALAAGIPTIVLNVRQDNAPALRVYERLGFRRYALFLEGPARRKPL